MANVAQKVAGFLGGIRDGVVSWVQKRFLSTSAGVAQERPIRERDYGSYPARRGRYALLWALYENTGYDLIHAWANQYKIDFSLYPNIRNVFNPVYRLVEFWASHVYTGSIDPECGDGSVRPSAIPIETRSEPLRPAIARVLKASDFEANKTVYARLGAATGDVALFGVDDTREGHARIEVIDGSSVAHYVADANGNCILYTIEEWRPDPRPNTPVDSYGEVNRVTYREDGELVYGDDGKPRATRFRTYLDDKPFDWHDGKPGDGYDWEEPYPFIPFVLVAHVKFLPKCPFGMAEAQSILSKIREIDDVASRFGDFVAKAVNAPWLMAGVPRPPNNPDGTPQNPTAIGGSTGFPVLYGAADARAQALLAPLDLMHVDGHIKQIKEEIEEDKPELRRDIENAVGDASGTALRVAQQRVETKAQTIRSGYDAALAKAITFCIRISGIRGYDGFESFTPEAIAANPKLIEFRIADRAVFRMAKLDELAVDEKFWMIVESAERAGVPVDAFLMLNGWPEDRIKVITDAQDRALAKGIVVGGGKQAPTTGPAAKEAVQTPGGAKRYAP